MAVEVKYSSKEELVVVKYGFLNKCTVQDSTVEYKVAVISQRLVPRDSRKMTIPQQHMQTTLELSLPCTCPEFLKTSFLLDV